MRTTNFPKRAIIESFLDRKVIFKQDKDSRRASR